MLLSYKHSHRKMETTTGRKTGQLDKCIMKRGILVCWFATLTQRDI